MAIMDLQQRRREPPVDEADEMFDMANLSEKATGIPGFVYISTAQGRHGPRVKYFQKLGVDQPSLTMSIARDPAIKACSAGFEPGREVIARLRTFVTTNHDALMTFWLHGLEMSDEEVTALKAGLVKA